MVWCVRIMFELALLIAIIAIFWSVIKRLVSTVENVVEAGEVLSSSLPQQASLYNQGVITDLKAKATAQGVEL